MSAQEKEKGWGGWSSWGKSLLSSATSTVGTSYFPFSIHFLLLLPLILSSVHVPCPHPCEYLPLCVSVWTGQSLTSVKTKAGEALRLHKTSVGEEAREEEVEEEGSEVKREGGGESGEADLSSHGESSSASAAASNKGVFSTITNAVQNTVSKHTRLIKLQNHRTKT